jgi:hypothetical protein
MVVGALAFDDEVIPAGLFPQALRNSRKAMNAPAKKTKRC